MPDNVVEIKVAATGVSEAGAQFEGFSEEVKAALQAISATAGVTAGDLNILQAVMKADQEAGIALSATLKDVASANGAFSAAVREAAAEAAVSATATQEVAAAAEHLAPAMTEAAGATTEAAAATRKFASDATQARFAAQLLAKDIGVPLPRALSSVAAQSSILGPILANAFPIIGAVALAEILYKVYERTDPLIAAEKNLAEVTKKANAEFEQLSKTFEHLKIEEATLELGKLAGLKVGAFYAETTAEEDKARINYLSGLIDRTKQKIKDDLSFQEAGALVNILQTFNPLTATINYQNNQDAKAQIENLKAFQIEFSILSAKAKNAAEQKRVDDDKGKNDSARDAGGLTNARISNAIAQASQVARIATETAEVGLRVEKTEADAKIDLMSDAHARAIAAATEDVTIATERADQLANIDKRELDAHVALLQQQKKTAGAGKDPAERAAAELRIDGEIAAAKAKFAEQTIQLYGAVSEAEARLDQVQATQQRERLAEKNEAEEKAFDTSLSLEAEYSRKIVEAQRKTAEEAKKAAADQRKSVEYGSAGKIGGLEDQRTEIQTKKDESTSPTDQIKYLEQLKELDRQIIQEKEQTQIRLIQLDSLNDPSKVAQDQAKLTAIQAAGQRTMAKDTEAIYKDVQKNVASVVHSIGDDLTSNVNKWITGQESFGKAMDGVWKNLATSAITSIEHIIEKQLEQIAIQQILKALGVDTSNAGQQAANNQKIATGNAGLASSDAALAAGSIFAYTLAEGGNLPDALEQAAIALAIGESFAGLASVSAMSGADLPNHNTLGFLHPREMVLPQSHADVIRGLAANGGARTSSSNVNVGSVNYSGPQMPEKHFKQMVKRLQRNANA